MDEGGHRLSGGWIDRAFAIREGYRSRLASVFFALPGKGRMRLLFSKNVIYFSSQASGNRKDETIDEQ